MIDIVDVTRDHMVDLAENMRREDMDEVWACSHHTPMDAIEVSIEMSTYAKSFIIDGHVVGIMGINHVNPLGGIGCAWWLSSTYLDKYKFSFIKHVKKNRNNLFGLKDGCDILVNYVDARYEKSLKWLEWLGFYINPQPVSFGVDGLAFHQIVMEVGNG